MIPPNDTARAAMDLVVATAAAMGFPPERVVDDVEGGRAAYWFGEGHRRVAALIVDNDGDVAALEEDRGERTCRTHAVSDTSATLRRLRAFVEVSRCAQPDDAEMERLRATVESEAITRARWMYR